MKKMKRYLLAPMLPVFSLLLGCAPMQSPTRSFVLTSSAFAPGQPMPDSTVLKGLDCPGPNISPDLAWTNAPRETQSFALVLDDFEARGARGDRRFAAVGRREGSGARLRSKPTPRTSLADQEVGP